MDTQIGWLQEEQDGPAKRVWMNIWETVSEMEADKGNNNTGNGGNGENKPSIESNNSNTNITNSTAIVTPENTNAKSTLTTSNSSSNFIADKTFNPTRRKTGSTVDNKASTFNLNKFGNKLVGKYGGCPWRTSNFHYSRGIVG